LSSFESVETTAKLEAFLLASSVRAVAFGSLTHLRTLLLLSRKFQLSQPFLVVVLDELIAFARRSKSSDEKEENYCLLADILCVSLLYNRTRTLCINDEKDNLVEKMIELLVKIDLCHDHIFEGSAKFLFVFFLYLFISFSFSFYRLADS
jgi:hypothetical protein